MEAHRDRRPTEAPDYLAHAAFVELRQEIERRGGYISWNATHLFVGDLVPISHHRCRANPDAVAAGLYRQLGDYHFDRAPVDKPDDTALHQERAQLRADLDAFQRLSASQPWRGRSYGSKRQLHEWYVLPWVNGQEDLARRIFQRLEMLVVSREQRGLKLIGVAALVEREILATRYDFASLWIWTTKNIGTGRYSNTTRDVGERLERLINDVLDLVERLTGEAVVGTVTPGLSDPGGPYTSDGMSIVYRSG